MRDGVKMHLCVSEMKIVFIGVVMNSFFVVVWI